MGKVTWKILPRISRQILNITLAGCLIWTDLQCHDSAVQLTACNRWFDGLKKSKLILLLSCFYFSYIIYNQQNHGAVFFNNQARRFEPYLFKMTE